MIFIHTGWGLVFTKRNRDFFHKCRSHAAFVKTHRFSVSTFSMSSYMYMTNVDTRDSNLQTRRRPVASFAQSGTPPWLNERTPTRRSHWQKIMPESSIAAQILIARNVHRRPISLCKYSAWVDLNFGSCQTANMEYMYRNFIRSGTFLSPCRQLIQIKHPSAMSGAH